MEFHPSPFNYQVSYRKKMQEQCYSIHFRHDINMSPIHPHHHDFCEAYMIISPKMIYEVEDQELELQSGDILFIPPGRIHWPRLDLLPPSAPYERIIIWLDCKFLSEMSSHYACDLFRPFDESWGNRQWIVRPSRASRVKMLNRMEETLQESFSQLPGSDMLVQDDICRILIQASRWMEEVHSDFNVRSQLDVVHRINEVCQYVQENCEKRLTLDQIAKQFYMNKYYMAHEFKKRIGISLGRYINQTRLQMAQSLLQNGYSPTELYIQCGFTQYSTFYRAFKAEFGIGPKEYVERQNCQADYHSH